MNMITRAILACVALIVCVPSLAAEYQLPTFTPAEVAAAGFLPSQYLTSVAPTGLDLEPPAAPAAPQTTSTREKPAAVTGELYTVVAPLFLGGVPDGGNISFVRFFNDSGHTTTFKVNVVGFKTDSTTDSASTILGTTNISVPSYASPQYAATDILSLIGWSSVACPVACLEHAYQGAALYVTTPDTKTAYQHVVYNPASKFFENMTLCGDKSYSDYKAAGNWIEMVNVHTSRLSDYPAYITIHNYAAGNRTYGFLFYDARTGMTTEPVAVVLKATLGNSSYRLPVSYFESLAKFVPSDQQLHMNVLVAEYDLNGSQAIGEIKAVAGLLVYNSALQSYVNMTQTCQITHRTDRAP